MSKKYKNKTCVYCTNPQSLTGDHVFAREFFVEKERGNLIKVPACEKCNNEKSQIEHYLVSVLPFGGLHGDSKTHLDTLVAPRLDKNRKLLNSLRSEMKYVWRVDNTGFYVRSLTIPIRNDYSTELFKYIAKGLAYYHWGTLIEKSSTVFAFSLTDDDKEIFKQWFFSLNKERQVKEIIGNNTFNYEGIQCTDDNQNTFWIFQTFNGLVTTDGLHDSRYMGAITASPELAEEIPKLFNIENS